MQAEGSSARYFIWEKQSRDVFVADESGVVNLPGGGSLMWRQYCSQR
jgi:hypothetical protein